MSNAESSLEFRSIRGQPSWVLRSTTIEMAVTELGAHMAPVRFDVRSTDPIEPYAISPWQGETEGLPAGGSELPLRGDFFCLPFGSGEAPGGEVHPPHGLTSSGKWTLLGSQSDRGRHSLHIGINTPVRSGRVMRTFTLLDGESVVYDATEIDGFSGPATLGHHAVLALPQREWALLVSSSPLLMGMTCPYPFGVPAEGNYQSLAIGHTFKSLARVRSIFRDTRSQDCSRFPARAGFTDLVQFAQRPVTGKPAWTAAVNTEKGYLWFALKDPGVLPTTLLWIENRGRHRPPWSGRNCSLGVEDVCSYFDMGISASAAPNPFSKRGVATIHRLLKERPFVVRYMQGVVRVPPDFRMVRKAVFSPGAVVFVDKDGRQARTAAHHEFLQDGKLPAAVR
jgi:hypothetical protein